MLKALEQTAAPAQINIVLNWFEELKQRVPVNEIPMIGTRLAHYEIRPT